MSPDFLDRSPTLSFSIAVAPPPTVLVESRMHMLGAQLLQAGISVSRLDLLIASVALVHDLTLVTHNTADFQNIPNLRLEDWLTP